VLDGAWRLQFLKGGKFFKNNFDLRWLCKRCRQSFGLCLGLQGFGNVLAKCVGYMKYLKS